MKRLSAAALAIGAAVKATGAHRYRHRTLLGNVHEIYRSDEHAFFVAINGEMVKVRPGVPVTVQQNVPLHAGATLEVRVVPSK